MSIADSYGTIQSVFHWFPEDPQWWITGFDYSRQSPDPARLVTMGYIDFSGDVSMYNSIMVKDNTSLNHSEEQKKKLKPYLIPDEEHHYVWFVWYEGGKEE